MTRSIGNHNTNKSRISCTAFFIASDFDGNILMKTKLSSNDRGTSLGKFK